jgi:2-keto-4-pentenoate hydratase/2-oxohepta-3-ene-1,7-dioic acid hydratase in catechol pathway
MKLATFSHGGEKLVGLVVEDHLLPLRQADGFPADMRSIIEQWNVLERKASVRLTAGTDRIPLSDVTLHAPVENPRKILAIGLNYKDHIAESGLPTPTEQVWFAKTSNTIVGPFDTVQVPKASSAVDYEVELVAVIGSRVRHVSVTDARKCIFGYCVGNDVSVRDWQFATPQWILGKSFDTHGPMGPFITTAGDIRDPHRLAIRSFLNGELRQSSNTAHLLFNLWEQIAHLTKAMTLEPGDVIFTGTPGGVGWASSPRRVLTEGDVVRCDIEELGAIENRFANER